jgi:hypothetical protein
MNNFRFEILYQELKEIKEVISKNSLTPIQAIEIIDRLELMRRLNAPKQTIMRYVRLGIIPEIKIGYRCCYNWPVVVQALEKDSYKIA